MNYQIAGSRWNDSLEITEQTSDVPPINVTKASPKHPMRMESMDLYPNPQEQRALATHFSSGGRIEPTSTVTPGNHNGLMNFR